MRMLRPSACIEPDPDLAPQANPAGFAALWPSEDGAEIDKAKRCKAC